MMRSEMESYMDAGDMGESTAGKVFVGGLSWQTTEDGLRYYFEKYGELTDVALMTDKRTGQPRGFGFITLKDPAAVDLVISQEHTIDGRLVDVKRAVPRDKAPAPSSRYEFRKIFVGGLVPEVTDKELSEYFSKFGPVKDAVVMIDRKTSRSRGFGFVTFETEDSLPAVIRTEHEISGKWVEVKRAEPRESRPVDGYGFYETPRGGGAGAGRMFRGGLREDPYGYPHYLPPARSSYPYAAAALRQYPGHPAASAAYGRAASYGGPVGGGYGYGGAGGPAGYYGGAYPSYGGGPQGYRGGLVPPSGESPYGPGARGLDPMGGGGISVGDEGDLGGAYGSQVPGGAEYGVAGGGPGVSRGGAPSRYAAAAGDFYPEGYGGGMGVGAIRQAQAAQLSAYGYGGAGAQPSAGYGGGSTYGMGAVYGSQAVGQLSPGSAGAGSVNAVASARSQGVEGAGAAYGDPMAGAYSAGGYRGQAAAAGRVERSYRPY